VRDPHSLPSATGVGLGAGDSSSSSKRVTCCKHAMDALTSPSPLFHHTFTARSGCLSEPSLSPAAGMAPDPWALAEQDDFNGLMALPPPEWERRRWVDGATPLIAAVSAGALNAAGRLLDKKVDVDAVNKSGATALWCAVTLGKLDMVRLLLDKGANPVLGFPASGDTPLMAAAIGGNAEMADVLTENYAAIQDVDRTAGNSALFYAAHRGNVEVRLGSGEGEGMGDDDDGSDDDDDHADDRGGWTDRRDEFPTGPRPDFLTSSPYRPE
jgi:hypothetical protein